MMYKVFVGSDELGGRYSRPLEIGRFADLQEAVRYSPREACLDRST